MVCNIAVSDLAVLFWSCSITSAYISIAVSGWMRCGIEEGQYLDLIMKMGVWIMVLFNRKGFYLSKLHQFYNNYSLIPMHWNGIFVKPV